MWLLLLPILLLTAHSRSVATPLSKADAAAGWLMLFDGSTLFGLTPGGAAMWGTRAGALHPAGGGGYIRTNSQFGEFVLRLEYTSRQAASVYLRVPATEDLSKACKVDLSGTSGSLNWRRVEIVAKENDIAATIDGRRIDAPECSYRSAGFIAFSSPSSEEGKFRNIHLKPLGMESLYNGTNMDGWKLVAPPSEEKKENRKLFKIIPLPSNKAEAAEWSIRDGAIHVEQGEGQLETTAVYDDFLLQAEVRSNGTGSSTGSIIVRGDAGKFKTGYEIRVDSQSEGHGRRPGEFAIGAIPPFENARLIGVEERKFFTATIVASGRHLAVWIDGQLVTDFEDRRPSGSNLSREARLGKGPIALGSSKETNLDFRRLRVRSLVPTPATSAERRPVAPLVPLPASAPGGSTISPTSPSGETAAEGTVQGNSQSQQIAQQEHQKHQVSQLMQQALSTPQPEQQVQLYSRILIIDPNNQVAYTARKEAQELIDKKRTEDARKREEQARRNQTAAEREQSKRMALANAERALFRGDLKTSRAAAELARKASPDDPNVLRMLNVIDSRLRVRSRVSYLLVGGCGVGGALLAIAFFRRLRHRRTVLKVVPKDGKEQAFDIKDDVTRIGAIDQDGGAGNDVVLDDPNRSISRFHCEIHNVKGKLYLIDCGSANGTFVDGKRLKPQRPAPIGRGSSIRLGYHYTLRIAHESRA